ncbi:hypothetical protein B9479_007940 [Cryptococcus floricola]|uniref:Uncharacterized protein n=1 Tax=Cryptococcus floricola TaxID=2591691 RepID=A0A5D3AN50_9TREE|nr:hypothetical protein B9479_007940 [Cryptococcus floricola]
MSKAPPMASEVDILKSKAANKKGAGSDSVETTWPKVEFFPDGVLVPIHARMVSVQPLQTFAPSGGAASEPACTIID